MIPHNFRYLIPRKIIFLIFLGNDNNDTLYFMLHYEHSDKCHECNQSLTTV